jgi:hypothetical protein
LRTLPDLYAIESTSSLNIPEVRLITGDEIFLPTKL